MHILKGAHALSGALILELEELNTMLIIHQFGQSFLRYGSHERVQLKDIIF
jgi:hypothetical protein